MAWPYSKCLKCYKEESKEYDAIHKEHKSTYMKEYCIKNKDKIKAGRRERYLKNRDLVRERSKTWRKNNKDIVRRRSKTSLDKKNKSVWYNIESFRWKSKYYISSHNLRIPYCSLCWLEWCTDFHHTSYEWFDKRKEWVFLCRDCHRGVHSWRLQAPEAIDLVELNAHMPELLKI